MSLAQGALFLLCVALATCAQSLTGFAFALVLLGMAGIFAIAPLADVANVATVLSLASALVALRKDRGVMDGLALRHTLIGMALGTLGGVALLAWLSANIVLVLKLLLGVTIAACAVSVWVQAAPLRERSSVASFQAAGLFSGLLGGLFATSGPPLVYHFYRQPMTVEAARGTLVAALAASSLLRLVMVVPAGQFSMQALQMCLLAAPLVVAITWLLQRFPPAWPRPVILRLVCALLLLAGASLVVSALSAL